MTEKEKAELKAQQDWEKEQERLGISVHPQRESEKTKTPDDGKKPKK